MITNVLVLCAHSPDARGLGGVQVVTADLARCSPPDTRVLVAYPHHGALWVETFTPRRSPLAILNVNIEPDPLDEQRDLQAALGAALAGTEADVLHVQNVNFCPRAILGATRAAQVPFVLALHDHSLVCENYQLLEGGRRYCGIPDDVARCNRCLASTLGRGDGRVLSWRETMSALVESCALAVAPSESVLAHAVRVHPDLAERAVTLPWGIPRAPRAARAPSAGVAAETLRVAVVGVHSVQKGAEQLPALLAACAHMPVDFHLFGATEGASIRAMKNSNPRVVVHGAYSRSDLARRLSLARCDLVLLPSVMPEAFSLVLSEVLEAGLPVMGSDLGALGERVRRDAVGWVFDPWAPEDLASRLSDVVRDRSLLSRARERVRRLPWKSCEQMGEEHARLWQDVARQAAPRPQGRGAGEALQRYRVGESRAAAYEPTALASVWAWLRSSNWYRDLRLRRMLDASTRHRVEGFFSRLARRGPIGK